MPKSRDKRATLNPYFRNPARDLERFAATTVAAWLGDRGTLVDCSAAHGPDFRIVYTEGQLAIGEVGWHADPKIQEMWASTFKRETHQTIKLPTGLGRWLIGLKRGANINQLYSKLPDLIFSLTLLGVERLSISNQWPLGDVAEKARHLGIEYLCQIHHEDPAAAIFFMPGIGGLIPNDANAVVEWVEDVLGDPTYQDTTEKLLRLDASERHVFLMSGSLTSVGADEQLRRLQDAVPTRSPRVPAGITHIWVVPQFGGTVAGLWIANRGWSTEALHDNEEFTEWPVRQEHRAAQF